MERGGTQRSGSLASAAGSMDTKVSSTDTKASDKTTTGTVSVQSDEASSAFVSLNPWNIFMACRNAKIVTVEPVVFLYMLGTFVYFPLYQQYYYLRFGIDQLEYTNFSMPNSSFCLNSTEIDEYGGNGTHKVVEKLSNNLLTYGSLSNRAMSIIATLIMGPLSDRYGRRPIIIVVATGMLIQGILSLFIVHFNLSVYLFILGSAIAGITGDFAAMLMACFTYVVDVGSLRWRTLRIAIAEAMLFFAGAIGEGLISGLWLQKLNCDFIPPLWVFIACALAIIGYTLVFLPESLSSSERRQQALKKQSRLASLATGFKILFCQFEEYAVWKLWGGLIIVFIVVMNMSGATGLNINYFKAKLSLDWDPEITGFYLGAQQLSHMVGLLVVLPILIACKLPDALIALIGLAMSCAMNTVVGLAWKTYQLFIVAAVGGLQSMMLPPFRSIMSKVVPDDKQGAIFSFVASVEVFASLVSGIIYPQVFTLTLYHNLPTGTIYFIMAGLYLVPVPVLLLLLFCGKRVYLCFPNGKEGHSNFLIKSHPNSDSERYQPYSTPSEEDALLPSEPCEKYGSSPDSTIN